MSFENSNLNSDYTLCLHNDNINTFAYVINILCDVCKYSLIQAEQCAIIAHNKGVCELKNSDYNTLKVLKEKLIEKNINVSIENNIK